MPGKAVQIISISEDQTFVLNDEQLRDILMHEQIKDRCVCVVSIAGVFRNGKTFLLNFLLKYLYKQYVHHDTCIWLGEDDVPLTGFAWGNGEERRTTGIQMWSEIFLHDYANGDKIAIILLDTQCALHSQNTVRNWSTVFDMSTLLSSIQIYNVSHKISEDDLHLLYRLTEYGRMALADTDIKPFQRLQFLVRDWSFSDEADYGNLGGVKLLDKKLQIFRGQHPELRSIRQHITTCFEEIACFLMPHPGVYAATNPNFDGRLKDVTTAFKTGLHKLLPMLLAPENLMSKVIGGHHVLAGELVHYFQSYVNAYNCYELPEPRNILVATAEATHMAAMAEAKELYKTMMDLTCGEKKLYIKPTRLLSIHLGARVMAVTNYLAASKLGGDALTQRFSEQLEWHIGQMSDFYRTLNESRNIVNKIRTPLVYVILGLIFLILSCIFNLLNMDICDNFSWSIMCLTLMTLPLWGFLKYSGVYSDLGDKLDDFASLLLENIMKPLYQKCFLEGTQQVARYINRKWWLWVLNHEWLCEIFFPQYMHHCNYCRRR